MDHLAEEQIAERRNHVWSDTYRGRHIATLRDVRAWRGVIDYVVQKDHDFESPEEAAAWLRRSVDALIAESIFPGLARL